MISSRGFTVIAMGNGFASAGRKTPGDCDEISPVYGGLFEKGSVKFVIAIWVNYECKYLCD
jgi:hypothetical protein